jgi:uncharacterized LabA/DUF88 family protein
VANHARTAVYVDGFNLYYAALKGNDEFKWLDLDRLANALLHSHNTVVSIRYYTARVSATPADPDLPTRQDTYIRALQAHIPHITCQFGQFKVETKTCKLVQPLGGQQFAEVWVREEKGSDVNLAVNLLNDAWADRFDVALVISNDSDLAEALHLARAQGKTVGVASVANRPTRELNLNCDFFKHIRPHHLRNSQLPDPVIAGRGRQIRKPDAWRRP